jgi:hypothetical protein
LGSTRSLIEYETSSTTLLGGLSWKPSEKLAIDLSLAWNRADAGLDPIAVTVPASHLAANPNQAYDLSEMHTASDLDLSRLEASLGFGWQISDRLALVGDFRYVDLEDDAPYLEDLTGTLFSWSAALRWRF